MTRDEKKADDRPTLHIDTNPAIKFSHATTLEEGKIKPSTAAIEPTLTYFTATNVIISVVIGAGIFVGTDEATQCVKDPAISLILWVVGGIVTLCGGLTYAELGAMFPESGADKVYLARAFPKVRDLFSFLYVWCRAFMVHVGFMAALSLKIPIFMRVVFGIDKTAGGAYSNNLYAALALILLNTVVGISTRGTNAIINLTTIIKVTAIATIAATGLAILIGNKPIPYQGTFDTAFETYSTDPAEYASALLMIFFGYEGWAAISLCAAEVKRPSRNLPLSTITACIVVTIAYALTVLSFHVGVKIEDVMQEEDEFGFTRTEEFGVWWGRQVFGAVGARVVAGAICISLIGAVTGLSFGNSRLIRSAAEKDDEYLPFSRLVRWTPNFLATPFIPVLLQTVIGTILCLTAITRDSFQYLIQTVQYSIWFFYTLAAAGMIVLRFTDAKRERPFKTFLLCPIIVVLVGLFMLIAPISDDEKRVPSLVGIGCMIPGALLWIWKRRMTLFGARHVEYEDLVEPGVSEETLESEKRSPLKTLTSPTGLSTLSSSIASLSGSPDIAQETGIRTQTDDVTKEDDNVETVTTFRTANERADSAPSLALATPPMPSQDAANATSSETTDEPTDSAPNVTVTEDQSKK